MSDLEGLTKTLIQVVGSLQTLLAQRGTSATTLQPEQPKLKKTPEMTYNQFVKKVLSTRKPVEVSSKKSTFKLQQDLELLSELSNYNQISIKTFEEISKGKRLNRSTDALRARYNDYLYRIDEKQIKKIVGWIEREGLEGYLVWDDDEMKIQHNDPEEKKEDKKRQRTTAAQSEAKKHEKLSKKSKTVPVNCKQLNEVLKLYSKMVNVPIKTLASKLDQLSGDLVALDNYIETKDARMLWTEEQDEVLRKGGPELEILKRYRGAGVEVRRKYLGL